jgi:hypothetical protein
VKRFILMIGLSLGLAIGTTACAHEQLARHRTAKTVLATAGIAIATGLVVMALSAPPCSQCSVDVAVSPR